MMEMSRRLSLPLPDGCLADLRQWARIWMQRDPVEGVDQESVLLLLTELVSNSIRHGSGPVDVDLGRNSHGLVLGVRDRSDLMPGRQPASADAEGGRGLFVVDALATRWWVSSHRLGGKTVWCEFATVLATR
jgi:anti-sigma regulatory factor (Ser/Thr protein kinase)